MPPWLAPKQVSVLNITDSQAEYCRGVAEKLKAAGFRADADLRNEKIGFKIREHTLHKVPFQLVVGDKEKETNTVAVRTRTGEDLGAMSIDELIAVLDRAIAERGRFGLEN